MPKMCFGETSLAIPFLKMNIVCQKLAARKSLYGRFTSSIYTTLWVSTHSSYSFLKHHVKVRGKRFCMIAVFRHESSTYIGNIQGRQHQKWNGCKFFFSFSILNSILSKRNVFNKLNLYQLKELFPILIFSFS